MRGEVDEPAGRGIRVRCRAVGLAVASALGMRKEAVDMDAGLTCAVAAQLRNLGLTLSSARTQAAILLRACARAQTATLPLCLPAAETKAWVALEDVADCCSWHFWASAWYGQQGERFVAVDHRRCIRMPFVPPCLMYNLSILQKRCATNGSARQKLGKRYERRKTHGLKNNSICVR